MLQVSEPIMHSIEVSGAAIKEAKRQVLHIQRASLGLFFECVSLGMAVVSLNGLAWWSLIKLFVTCVQVTEPIMHTVEASSAFLHETQRQVSGSCMPVVG